jgi:hypothetical protein
LGGAQPCPTLATPLVKVEDMQLEGDRLEILIGKYRPKDTGQKLKLIKRLLKDKINPNIFDTVSDKIFSVCS